MFLPKIKKQLELCNFRISDLFFVVGLIPMSIFLIFGQLFMQHPNPDEVDLKLFAIIPLFVLLLVSWGLYLFFEYKNGLKVNRNIMFVFIVLAIIGIIGIVIQPEHFEMGIVTVEKEEFLVEFNISKTHYVFFAFDIVSILLFIYICLFVLPSRFQTIKIIYLIGWAVIIGSFALIIYSYIFEYEKYVFLFNNIGSASIEDIKKYHGIESFIINPNAYAMVLMIGIIFCCLNHFQKRKWYHLLILFFLLINMVFSLCRVCLIITLFIILIYIYYYLIHTYKDHKKRNLAFLILISSILFISILVLAISYLSKGLLFSPIYNVINIIGSSRNLEAREIIWENVYQILRGNMPSVLFFGRGFGLINEMLLQANIYSGLGKLTFPTHNSYLGLFAEGGFIYLLSYIVLLGYMATVTKRCFKKDPTTALCLSFGLVAFVFYSLIETIHYLVYPFMFLMLILDNVTSKENK